MLVGIGIGIGAGANAPSAHTLCWGLAVGQGWPAMATQLARLPAPVLVVLNGQTEHTTLASLDLHG